MSSSLLLQAPGRVWGCLTRCTLPAWAAHLAMYAVCGLRCAQLLLALLAECGYEWLLLGHSLGHLPFTIPYGRWNKCFAGGWQCEQLLRGASYYGAAGDAGCIKLGCQQNSPRQPRINCRCCSIRCWLQPN